MSVRTLISFTVVVSACLSAFGADPEWAPTKDVEHRNGFWFSYDGRARLPRWTLERLNVEELKQVVRRDSNPFRGDEGVLPEARAIPSDYDGTGYDRGHMAPADSHRDSPEELRETFLMTNMAPQSPQCNRGWWRSLEEHTRELAREPGVEVWIITVPLFWDDDNDIDIKVIGRNRVWVPTHFGKSVLVKRKAGYSVTSWIGPNAEFKKPLDSLKVSVDVLESVSGFDLWQGLPDEVELEKIP